MKASRRDFIGGSAALVGALSVTPALSNVAGVIPTIAIGCGNRGKQLIEMAVRSPAPCEILAFCDIAPEKMQAQRDLRAKSARLFDSVDALLSSDIKARLALVATPNDTHLDITRKLLDAGYYIYLEKPMVTTLDDARELIRLDEQSAGRIQVGLQKRHMPLYAKVGDVVRSGQIGNVRHIVGHEIRTDWFRFWPDDPEREKRDNWRYFRARTGGSILEKLCHDLDILNTLIGSLPIAVQAVGGKAVWLDRETIDHAIILVEYANGAKISFNFNLFASAPLTTTSIFGDRGALQFERTGTLINQWNKVYPPKTEPDTTHDLNPEKKSAIGYFGTAEGLANLTAAMNGSGRAYPRPRDAWPSMVLCMAATRSVDEGGIRISLDDAQYAL